MSLHLRTNLSYPSRAVSHECNISLVSASSRLLCRCTVCLLVDLASVGLENSPPVTNSYLSSRSSPFCMIISDKTIAISDLFSSVEMKMLHTCGSGTCGPSITFHWFCLANVAIKYCINSAYISIEVASHNFEKGICIFSKCLTTIRFSKFLD